MREVKINVYDFKELDKKVQDKVIQKFRNEEEFDMLSEVLHNELATISVEFGFKPVGKVDLNYSLSNCQGDGVCFMGEFLYEKDNQKLFIKKNSHRYSHYNTVDITIIDLSTGEEVNDELEYNAFKEMYKEMCDKLEKSGYDYIEDVIKEENIIVMINSNEFEFYKDGRIFKGE